MFDDKDPPLLLADYVPVVGTCHAVRMAIEKNVARAITFLKRGHQLAETANVS